MDFKYKEKNKSLDKLHIAHPNYDWEDSFTLPDYNFKHSNSQLNNMKWIKSVSSEVKDKYITHYKYDGVELPFTYDYTYPHIQLYKNDLSLTYTENNKTYYYLDLSKYDPSTVIEEDDRYFITNLNSGNKIITLTPDHINNKIKITFPGYRDVYVYGLKFLLALTAGGGGGSSSCGGMAWRVFSMEAWARGGAGGGSGAGFISYINFYQDGFNTCKEVRIKLGEGGQGGTKKENGYPLNIGKPGGNTTMEIEYTSGKIDKVILTGGQPGGSCSKKEEVAQGGVGGTGTIEIGDSSALIHALSNYRVIDGVKGGHNGDECGDEGQKGRHQAEPGNYITLDYDFKFKSDIEDTLYKTPSIESSSLNYRVGAKLGGDSHDNTSHLTGSELVGWSDGGGGGKLGIISGCGYGGQGSSAGSSENLYWYGAGSDGQPGAFILLGCKDNLK